MAREIISDTVRRWSVDGRVIVSEVRPGIYELTNWMSLDRERLARMHYVLGEILTELAVSEEPTAVGAPPY